MDLSRPFAQDIRLEAGEVWAELSGVSEMSMCGPNAGTLRTSTGFVRHMVMPGPKLSADGTRLAFVELRHPDRHSRELDCHAVVVELPSHRCVFESGPYGFVWVGEVTATGVTLVDALAGVGSVLEFDFVDE